MLKKCFRDAFGVSLIFYIVSNFFVFVGTDLYSKDLFGFIQCYVLALPFFLNRLSLYTFACSFLCRNIFQVSEGRVERGP
jgi:hypothetical protein